MPGRARAHFRAAAGGGASCFFLEEFGCFGDSFSGAFRWRESQSCCYDRASVRTESVPILWEDGNFPGCKSAGVQGGERENRQLRYGRAAENKKRPVEKQVAALFCDADRTQTCNLLIRRRNFGVFAVFWEFFVCFINSCISVANIAILFYSVFVWFD